MAEAATGLLFLDYGHVTTLIDGVDHVTSFLCFGTAKSGGLGGPLPVPGRTGLAASGAVPGHGFPGAGVSVGALRSEVLADDEVTVYGLLLDDDSA